MNVKITDSFFNNYKELIRTEMIPYQWKVLNDEIDVNIERERNDDNIPNRKSHALENFRIAAGLKEGHHYGWVFQDSDVYKWLEAVAYSLKNHPDEELKKLADDTIHLIGQAQEESGYLSTYFTIDDPGRKFKRLLESHELYCAGHFIEAAVAYYETTGNKEVLDIAVKLADFLDSYFGNEEGKTFGYDGHEEIEIGLIKLYRLTGEKRYLELAVFFLDARGQRPDYFSNQINKEGPDNPVIPGMKLFDPEYAQDHLPVRKQETAEGHAVRLVYMCEAMADAAYELKDEGLLQACKTIYHNIVDKRMYITGGIGSTFHGERFTYDYDLPNDTMYCESCASIGLFHFMYRMVLADRKAEYADVMERALYNTILGGIALDGKHYFYVNPLEANPIAYKKDPGKSHVKPVRPEWLGCACCPPNLARCLSSLDNYIYAQIDDMIYVNLFIQSRGKFDYVDAEGNTVKITIEQKTDYPKSGKIEFKVSLKQDAIIDETKNEEKVTDYIECEGMGESADMGERADMDECKDMGESSGSEQRVPRLAVRIPGWADSYEITVKEESLNAVSFSEGYAIISLCQAETNITLNLPMTVTRWYANTNVRDDIGKVAISRGPQVYCMEGVDNPSDILCKLNLPKTSVLKYEYDENLLGGVGVITADGIKISEDCGYSAPLYRKSTDTKAVKKEQVRMKWIPYYAWANRGENEMQVWVREM